jgi:hypothetical protein
MVRIFFIFSVLGILMTQSTYSCDACGCSISGYGMGMFSSYHNNFISLNWQLSKFNSAPGHGNSIDYFNTLEISVQYFLSDKFKILLSQPIKVNRRISSSGTDGLSGLSDTRITASYSFFKNEKITEESKLFLDFGAGIKLPAGNFNPHLHDLNLPENFNLGNGSWGFLFQPNAVLSFKDVGIVLSAVYQAYTKSSSDYKFGNQMTGQSLIYWSGELFDNFTVTPFGGINSEWAGEDKYANGNTVHATGGNGLFAVSGLNVKTGDWLAGVSYLHPLSTNYSGGAVDASGRLNAQLSYIF